MDLTSGISHGGPTDVDAAQWDRPAKRSLCCIDFKTSILLLVVWALLCTVNLVLLGGAKVATLHVSEASQLVTPNEVGVVIMLNTVPVLFCAIFNDVLIDRSWRRIAYFAIETKASSQHPAQLADHLCAANFNIWDFVCRLTKASPREWRSAASYALLRWGTTISIASAQLCVSWKPYANGYVVHERYLWFFVPVILHAISIFGAIMLWRWPWIFFLNKFGDRGLHKQYQPITCHVQGSLASYKEIAAKLETGNMIAPGWFPPVYSKVRTGRQIWAKLKGVLFGLVGMFISPALIWILHLSHYVLTLGQYRFIFNLVFLAQNVFYGLALDFVIWNVSLDGFCAAWKAAPNRNLRHLGYSSGIMLFFKILRQRRPVRAACFLLLFWMQACVMRVLLVLLTIGVTVLSYYSPSDLSVVLDPRFWISWLVFTLIFGLLPFIPWIFWRVEAPVGPVDGWRWAQIASVAVYSKGFYGIIDGPIRRAGWARNVKPFTDFEGQEMA